MSLLFAATPSALAETNIITVEEQEKIRLLRSDLTLISQFGGVIDGVNDVGDLYVGFNKGYNVDRSIAAGRAVAGSVKSDLYLIAQFGGVIDGVNGVGDKYQGFGVGYNVDRSIEFGRAIFTKPVAQPPQVNIVTDKINKKISTISPEPEVLRPTAPAVIERRDLVYTEGLPLTLKVFINNIKATKATLFLLEGRKTTVLDSKFLISPQDIIFTTSAAVGSYFVLLSTGERSETVDFDVRPFGLSGIRILDATAPVVFTVPTGDLGPSWNIVLMKNGVDHLSRVITEENRGMDIRFRLPVGEGRYTVRAEFKYQVTDSRTGEVSTKIRTLNDPLGGAVIARNPGN